MARKVNGYAKKVRKEYEPYLKLLPKDSHKHQILKYMLDHRSITDSEARDNFECHRLAGRIHELRGMGLNIITMREDNVHTSGQHARYWLETKE